MNEDIIKDLIRMRELLNINEQSPDQSITEILKSNDVVRIKEFLLQKPDLQKKLEELFSSPTIEDLATKILNSNKTIIMRGLQRSSMARDVEMYEFLNALLSSKK
jgi:hypothetical protein